MKKKVLAVLLAVCMIAGTCVLFASAAPFNKGTYVKLISGTSQVANNLASVSKDKDFNISIKVTGKTDVTMSKGDEGKAVTADNVDKLVSFKQGGTDVSFKNVLSKYYSVSGTIGNSSSITFTEKTSENDLDGTIFEVINADITATDATDVSANLKKVDGAKKYIFDTNAVTATVSKWENKLSSVTMGVRFFGGTYDNLVASEIAKVDATVVRNGKPELSTKVTTSVTNVIKDLMIGDTVTLTASLKDDAEKDYYGFYCWVDSNGNVLSTSETITHTVDGSDAAFYATFVELKNRWTIDYSSNGNGKVIYNEGREVFSGDAQISVLDGRDATFTFVPDEGYEVAKVVIDGTTDIASFKSINLAKLLTGKLAALKALINATNKDTYCYTFPAVSKNHSIEVTFSPIENFEAPSGLDLPTVEAEGITLATGAADENGEGSGDGATTVPAENGAAGNGGSAVGGVVNPATGSTGAIAVFSVLSVAAGAAFVTAKKKEN